MSEREALKPCPFCGLEPFDAPQSVEDWADGEDGKYWSIWCNSCDSLSGKAMTKVEAIASWNTRALAMPDREAIADPWQPIETIPTDGTEVLAAIYVRSSVRGEGWWERHVIAIDDETGEVVDSLYGGWDRADYSHWHELPAAPLALTVGGGLG